MWQIKQTNPKTNKPKIVKTGFATEELANKYLSDNYKDREDIWVEEKGGKKSNTMDMSDKIGLWIWILSTKKNEFFPYGIIMDHTSQFIKIKTKEADDSELSDMRIERIKNMIENKSARFEVEGHFVNLKEYL